ncbi:MAG: site-2 protease family protein [bacterium]
MLEKILIFIVFLCPIVFVHELGHFLFARLFGVRVEVFSIGFGPKLLKWKKKTTEYAISLIPLGGYVKMFGDDPLNKDELPEEERKYSYVHKNKWAKFWIIFGGPLANIIFAYILYIYVSILILVD